MDVTPADAGTYICIARNKLFHLEVPTHIVVTGALPRFTQAPRSALPLVSTLKRLTIISIHHTYLLSLYM